ncbi:hypothetical protein SDRG_03771 [Saprolegnia diclina VS20]|uniref:HutD family protein n=1 Tax=Saprolegnia diclina (strain VS20) TaxID=1156394 RepID=T0S7S0_SAPDV|nr:hypothetical protein SDRG_03771 [Saprolegnia diclina VS20]EQC38812.1 hypothetical protein SDRG_03771 [Saprolegnia diclina VS20]|eukprot:XP_008607636.1 hypothetical protein SDRG_03771 [Saprolegnia diclina VS20]
MTEWQHVTFDDVAPTPWKNGGGETRQLVAWPQGADDWTLRVSIADVTQDGPFSSFDGIRRWFTVLSGDGVRLFEDMDICVGDKLYEFDGALAPACSLLGSAVRDFNVMYREADGGSMVVTNAKATHSLYAMGARFLGLFTVDGGELMINGLESVRVSPMTLVWAQDTSAELVFSSHGPGAAFWLHLE